MRINDVRRLAAVAASGALALSLAACGSSTSNSTSAVSAGHNGDWAKAQSAADGGGMDALVAAAKKEGQLNVIALPRTWANYGELMDTFQKKYGITVNDANPDGSSGDEINALKSTKGQASAPDVVDVGNSYAVSGAKDGLYASYKVATWGDIPANIKDDGGLWWADLGGYMSIGCNAAAVGGTCPKTFKDLDNPAYKGKVALSGDPTSGNSPFNAVWAAALANGGSADSIQPGIDFFKKLNSEGIYNKTKATDATTQAGATPIVVNWDYLNLGLADKLKSAGVTWTVTVPSDGLIAAYYDQAVNANAPHPAAARLWQEFLYSQDADGGQNGWIKGFARPAELAAMLKNGKAVGADKLPAVDDKKPFTPSEDQTAKAKAAITSAWAAAVQ
ncbi:ABC transporter substrate-binding protein [Sinomonas sp. ASV322]|uniref:ABC transporter substrate-binding protein n=1 Tax=Sinomonas sp. ASV322 TaxID=3041920 RepID=UPI0027DB6AA9|nr:ABC transporter substrate-binding protein [Sinomonas sp. ASV322]MDQ4502742.1 ABC transporter substrate-binding protein [Sinomonas sp. ASV322]